MSDIIVRPESAPPAWALARGYSSLQMEEWRRSRERRARLERESEHAARQAEERRRRQAAAEESRRFEAERRARAVAEAEERERQRALEAAAAAAARAAAREAGEQLDAPPEPPRIPIWLIQRVVAEYFKVPMADLSSARRQQTIVWPRQVAMYLSRHLTPRSYPDVGSRFGGRDHTTVLHGVKKVEWALTRAGGAQLAVEIEAMRAAILERAEILARQVRP